MATLEAAKAAKEIFKQKYWSKNPDIFNIISINEIYILDENEDITAEEFDIKVYLFDVNDAKDLPNEIDGVEIRYLPVVEKDV